MEQNPEEQISAVGSEKIIKTKRLLLRAAQMSDLDEFYTIFSNDEVMKYWSRAPHTNPSETALFLTALLKSPTNGLTEFAITLPSPDGPPKVIGRVGIWSLEKSEIGFMLNRAYWGKGYMAEALSALINHIWSGTGGGGRGRGRGRGDIQKIVADVDPRNTASVGLLKNFGFEETGYEARTWKTHLGWCDSLYLALHKPGAPGAPGTPGVSPNVQPGDEQQKSIFLSR